MATYRDSTAFSASRQVAASRFDTPGAPYRAEYYVKADPPLRARGAVLSTQGHAARTGENVEGGRVGGYSTSDPKSDHLRIRDI
jgi:hypothetical protein